MKILGICGFAGAGKNAAATQLLGWKDFSFAKALKKMAASIIQNYACVEAPWDNADFKNKNRPLLVWLGEFMRGLEPDFWIDMLQDSDEWEKARARDAKAVITDLRYRNEANWVRSQGGLVLRIDRPGFGPCNDEEARSFAEIEVAFPQMIRVCNDGTEEELGAKVRAIADDPFNWRSV